MRALFVLVVGLGTPGILPALAVARRSPALVFLAPLIAAGMAAAAAVIELGLGGSLVTDYVLVAVVANLAVLAWWRVAGRSHRPWAGPPWGWSIATVVVVLGSVAIPLTALRSPMIGWDANSIWLTHAMMVHGGHHELLTGLQNVAYRFSNPDYPPLVPAAGALAFAFFGLGNLHLAVDMTVLLSACALGVVGTGIAAAGIGTGITVGRTRGHQPGIAAVAAAGAICLVGFAVSGVGAIEGYTDLLWAAAAAGAVIWGLVLPESTQALGVAWICAAVASLTKNEGLTTALVVLVLIALRYRPLTLPGPMARRWAERAAFVVVPALPGLAWAGLVRLIGVHDAFFMSASAESPATRAGATVLGMAAHLAVAPVDLAVLLVGCWFLRGDRKRARLGNPAWLWAVCLGSLAIIFATYVAGGLEIHGWLGSSVDRTTIFVQVLLYADLAIWLVIAVDGAFTRADSEPVIRPDSEQRDALEAPPWRAPLARRPTTLGSGQSQLASAPWKYSTVRASPSWSGTVGSHPSSSLARLMSGLRRAGSSVGSGRCCTGQLLSVRAMTCFASSSTVNSPGLPRLIGPVTSGGEFISLIRPSTMSSI